MKSEVERLFSELDGAAEFCRAEAARADADEGFPSETFRLLADKGFYRAPLAVRFGGAGLGIENGTTLPLLMILKRIGSLNLAVGRVYEGHVNALQLINTFGTPAQIERFARDARDEHKLFGVWNTEAADGVKIFPDGKNCFRLAGAKTFASGSGFVTRPFVNCALPDGGWQMCVVPMESVETTVDPTWWRPLGMRATRSFRVDFTGVELCRENLIGEAGDYYRQPYFSGGAIRFAAVQLGGAESLFDETRKFLQTQNRTEDAYQRARLGEMAMRVESGNGWLRGAARIFDDYLTDKNDEKIERVLAYAAMTRTAIEQICQDVMLFCERSVGARGLMRPLPFERIIRDLTIYLRQPAPDATLDSIGKFVLENTEPARDLWNDER